VSTWSHPVFERLAALVGAGTGLSFDASRHPGVEAGIRRAMERARVADPSEYLRLIERRILPLDDVVGELTVGETYFFREPHHFDVILDDVRPAAQRRYGPAHRLRVWSAGCASGEEAYSAAILLAEAGVAADVLATDVSRAALARAEQATYRPWSLRGLDETRTRRWFRPDGNRWMLHERFRAAVRFECHNLYAGPFPPANRADGFDVILCRNVLIYLGRDTVARVARGLAASLAEGGWLFTGPSDPMLSGVMSLEPVVTAHGVFYRKATATPRAAIALVEPPRPGDVSPPPGVESASGVVRLEGREPDAGAPAAAALAVERDHEAPRPQPPVDAAEAGHRVRVLANGEGSSRALAELARHLARFPLSTELHLLEAVLLVDVGRHDAAAGALRRVLYLDASSAVAHFLLASVLRRLDDLDGARREYRAARDLAAHCPPDEPLPFGEGEQAGRLARLARAELAALGAADRPRAPAGPR
jgi:chemotaxis protein methyltransferase CheR